jgi:hypothetical protein
VSDGGHGFATASRGHVGKNKINDRPGNVSESVPVEEKKWSAPVALPQEF